MSPWSVRMFHSNFSSSSDPQLCANSEKCSAHSFPVTLHQTSWSVSVHICMFVFTKEGAGLWGRFPGLSFCIATTPSLEVCATTASSHLKFPEFWSRSPQLSEAAVFLGIPPVLLGRKPEWAWGSPHLFPSLRHHSPALLVVQGLKTVEHIFFF